MNIKHYLKSNIWSITKKLYHCSIGISEYAIYLSAFGKSADYIEKYTTHDPIILLPIFLPIGVYASCDAVTRIFNNENLIKFYKREKKKEEKEEKERYMIIEEEIKKIINTKF